MLGKTNFLGAVTAIAFFASAILVFTFRLLGKPQYGRWIGYFEFLLAIPLIFLLVKAPQLGRPTLVLHPDRLHAGMAGSGSSARLHSES